MSDGGIQPGVKKGVPDGGLVARAIRSLGLRMALVCLSIGAPANAASFVDDAARPFELDRAAQRVITLAPNLTELVYAVGGGSALVGTVTLSTFPDEAKAVPRVGDHQRFDIERILLLKPDLVLAWYPAIPAASWPSWRRRVCRSITSSRVGSTTCRVRSSASANCWVGSNRAARARSPCVERSPICAERIRARIRFRCSIRCGAIR